MDGHEQHKTAHIFDEIHRFLPRKAEICQQITNFAKRHRKLEKSFLKLANIGCLLMWI